MSIHDIKCIRSEGEEGEMRVCVCSAAVLLYNVSPCSYVVLMQDISEASVFQFRALYVCVCVDVCVCGINVFGSFYSKKGESDYGNRMRLSVSLLMAAIKVSLNELLKP